MRASGAAKGTRKGLTGAIQEAFLGILSVLLAMLEDFRAGRLAPMAPVAVEAGDGAVADPAPQLVRSAAQSPARAEGAEARPWRGGFDPSGADWAGEETLIPIADQRASSVDSGKGAAEITRAETAPRPPALRTNPAKGDRTILRAPPRAARFGMIARLRPRAGWRNARGIRRALPPYGEVADGAEAKFFKNAGAGERISAALLFQDENDAVAAWSRRIFS